MGESAAALALLLTLGLGSSCGGSRHADADAAVAPATPRADEPARDLYAGPPGACASPEDALGDTSGLDPVARAMLADDGRLHVVAEPSSWYDAHSEPEQSFADWAERPTRRDAGRRRIYLQPIGDLGGEAGDAPLAAADVAAFLAAYFQRPVYVLRPVPVAGLALPLRSRESGPQLATPDVIGWLVPRVPSDAYALVAVTMTDLYAGEGYNFVFGWAAYEARVGVYSFARYDEAFDHGTRAPGWETRFRTRAIGLMAHEVGHTFGLRHCVYYDCLMNAVDSLYELDEHPALPCPVCLRKLYTALGFDPRVREEALLSFYRAFNLVELSLVSEQRLELMRQAE
ncbi:MAG: archaemetzincin [Myxococcota bacterium]